MKKKEKDSQLALNRPKSASKDQMSVDSQTAPSISPTHHVHKYSKLEIILYGKVYPLDCSCWNSLQDSLNDMKRGGVSELTSLSIALLVLRKES